MGAPHPPQMAEISWHRARTLLLIRVRLQIEPVDWPIAPLSDGASLMALFVEANGLVSP